MAAWMNSDIKIKTLKLEKSYKKVLIYCKCFTLFSCRRCDLAKNCTVVQNCV
jgi:hypothetical protein